MLELTLNIKKKNTDDLRNKCWPLKIQSIIIKTAPAGELSVYRFNTLEI